MQIWPVLPVSMQPIVTLVRWRVFQTEQGGRHFAGYCVESDCGRVSSAIVSFDIDTRTATTTSGRRYVLSGGPGYDGEAALVWLCWAVENAVEATIDVSEEYESLGNSNHS